MYNADYSTVTFSVAFLEVSGFTNMEGGADAGGFRVNSPFVGNSLVSNTELHTEGALLFPLRGTNINEESWEEFSLAPVSTVPAPRGRLEIC